jgi:SAM-dependent methyltransferase
VHCQPAHELNYEPGFFDLVIATGVSCYYPIDYWAAVVDRVKPLLKPGGLFVFDAILPELPLAENWAILETYLGAEVFLEEPIAWKKLIQAAGGKVTATREGDVFALYRVKFS